MNTSIRLRTNQHLALTPQLRQAIRLLQLSRQELEVELRQCTEGNAMLDLVEDLPLPVGPDTEEPAWEPADDHDGEPEMSAAEPDMPQGTSRSDSNQVVDIDIREAAPEGLREHLMWQLEMASFTQREYLAAALIIDALDSDGYLRCDLAQLAESVPVEPALTLDELHAVRRKVQDFDPVGVACTDLADCLGAQLEQTEPDAPARELARDIVSRHLDLVAANDIAGIARSLRATPEDVAAACDLIRQLDPHPGTALDSSPVEYIVPDAYAWHDGKRWQVTLDPANQPRLELNQHYCQLMHEACAADASWMRAQLQEARWLIKSVQTRADTLLRVTRAIVNRQHAFLDYGPEALRPLLLREIAEEVGMHESTISRVTTRKYLNTPRGNFEFKYFFSTGLATDGGGSASTTAIQAVLRKLIAEENPRKPLSDQALANAFVKQGVNVARRTITKYREALRIPRSTERRRVE